MTATYVVKVDGKPCPFSDVGPPFRWEVRGGVAAPIQAWELPKSLVSEIVKTKAGQELELELDGRTIRRVYVLGNAPSGDPQTELLVMTDVRWYLSRSWLVHDFNVRRRVGDRRLVGTGDEPAEVKPNVADVQYAGWSLDGATPYLYAKVLERVKKDVEGAAVAGAAAKITWTVDPTTFMGEDRIVEETSMDDPMPVGLARALGALPGRNLYVDDDGVMHVYDAIPGAEKQLVGQFEWKLPRELEDHGSLAFVDMSASRSPTYRVLFTPEVEIKITYDTTRTWSVDDPYLENVLEVPDASLSVPASAASGRGARTVAHGTYITHAEAYEAWGAGGIFNTPLTDDIVRSGYLGKLLEATYVNYFGQADAVWQRRIRAVRDSYRTLFRVNPKFWGRVLSARAVRVKVVDDETGTRSASPVFANSAQKYSIRALVAGNTALGDNETTSYSETVNSANPARAHLDIVDFDQGILGVSWRLDKSGIAVEVAPSAIEEVPDYDPEKDPAFRVQTWSTRKLVATHKLATILSLVPAGPNDMRRLCEVKVTVQEAMQALRIRGDIQSEQPESKGPETTLRVSGQRATRRYGWEDGQNARDALMGFFKGDSSDERTEPEAALEAMNEEETVALARAQAAAHVVQYLDHWEGELRVPVSSKAKVRPLGSVSSVTYEVGKTFSRVLIRASHAPPQIDPFALLPAGVRKVLAREVQP